LCRNKITVLDNSDSIVETKSGDQIRIGGLSTRYDMKWLESFSGKNGCKLLLCHHPEYYQHMICDSELDNFDLIISGHAQGGQVRLFGKSLFSPGQGFFQSIPKAFMANISSLLVYQILLLSLA